MPVYAWYALYVCVGCTGQMVAAASIFKPFLANVSDTDIMAYFGEHTMEEAEVSCYCQLSLNKLYVCTLPNKNMTLYPVGTIIHITPLCIVFVRTH